MKVAKPYGGSDLAYFQPWLEMIKSETMSKWEAWGDILKIMEEAGERRLDPNPVEISDIFQKSKGRKTPNQIKDEFFRIFKGMTGGDALAAIVQGMGRDVLDVFRRFISNGKSRTSVVVREFRQKTDMPRRAKNIWDYDAVAAEWGADVAKFAT